MTRREILLLLALVASIAFTTGRWSSSGSVLASHSFAPSISVQTVSKKETVDANKSKAIQLYCPAGYHVAAGGYYNPNRIEVLGAETGPSGNDWIVRFINNNNHNAASQEATALCFKLNP